MRYSVFPMDIARRIPLWAWWASGLAAISVAAAGAVWLVADRGPTLPPELAEKRAAAAKLLEQASRIEDVDIKPLLELEAKRDYTGAVALMEQALGVNALQEELNGTLVGLAHELSRLALGVTPDEAGARAVEAFGVLARLAEAEKKFYEDRRQLYELTHEYYAGLAARKRPPIPPGLRQLVDAVNADLEKAKGLHRDFAAAAEAFDETIRRK